MSVLDAIFSRYHDPARAAAKEAALDRRYGGPHRPTMTRRELELAYPTLYVSPPPRRCAYCGGKPGSGRSCQGCGAA